MKFVADECCDAGLISLLRSEGHDTIYIKEFRPGALDKEVLEKAFAEERILLTEDKDFGELIYRLEKPAYGVVLLRFDVHDRVLKWPRLRELINKYGYKLKGLFVVVDIEKFRSHPLLWQANSEESG
jgi:predicted nuclease of predicted toxin-antitoxin system